MDGMKVPIDGTHCMACGHQWRSHGSLKEVCYEQGCKCKRCRPDRDGHNIRDWQSRIRELEAALITLARELHEARNGLVGRIVDDAASSVNFAESIHPAWAEAMKATNANPTCAAAIEKARNDPHATP